MTHISDRFVFCAAIFLWILVILRIGLIVDEHMWDFEQSYYLAKANAAGLDCFKPGKSDKFIRKSESETWRYPYFPLSIYLFRPFALLSLDTAKYIFLVVKCVTLVYLFYLWQCKLLRNPTDPFFLLFCLFAFNAAIFLDLRSGNYNLIEQAFLWSAFYFFVERRVVLFCILLLLAAMVKVVPILFACLLFLDKMHKRAVILLAIVMICGTFLVLFPCLNQLGSFFSIAYSLAHGFTGGTIFNLSTFSLIRFSIEKWSTLTHIPIPWIVGVTAYLGLTAIVGWASYRTFSQLDMEKTFDRKYAVYLACLVYALTVPLFQDYQWTLLLVPTYFIMLHLDVIRTYPVLFACAALSAAHQTLPGATFFFDVFWNYYPLAVAWLVWVLYVTTGRKSGGNKTGLSSSPVLQ